MLHLFPGEVLSRLYPRDRRIPHSKATNTAATKATFLTRGILEPAGPPYKETTAARATHYSPTMKQMS